MPDQQDLQAAVETRADLSTEIGSSLAAVWARYVGARPTGAVTKLDGSVVRWVLAGGTEAFDAGMAAVAEAEPQARARTVTGYKRETAAAVAHATRRRVMAVMSDHDAKTGVATETFVLDSRPRKY
jgi:hypothetical protein